MYYEDDDDEELGEFYNDVQDIAQYDPVNQQTANNHAETSRAEREITRLAIFSSLYPEEDVEKLRAILEDCDYELEKAIDLLKELKNDNKKATKSGPQENQVKRLAQSGDVPKRHAPEAIESKLELILETYPNANDTAIRHRLENSIDLDLESLEIVNELETPEESSEDRNVSEHKINMDRGMKEYLSEENKINLIHITQIFPDVDPHFLFQQIAVQLKSLETIVDEMTRDSSYPKLKHRLEKERQERRRQEFLNSEFDIEYYLHLFEDPKNYFNDCTRKTTDLYNRHALVHLKNLFRDVQEDFLQWHLKIHFNHFLPAFRHLKKDGQPRRAFMAQSQYTYEERAVIPWPDEVDEMFFRELQYLQHEHQIEECIAERQRQRELREHEAEVKGQLIECQCCLNNNKLPEDMLACQENFNHIFCRGCVRQHAEMQVSQGFHRVICMTGFCSAEYNVKILQNLLRPASMDILLRRRQQDELRNAQLDNMESCSFCDFAMVIENHHEKVFKCQNPDCLRESCRQCKEPNHIPLRCNEVENDAETRMRTYIENKMAEAWIRICPKCNKRLIKSDGCNALHCPCGAGICYVCNELLPQYNGYGHFAGVEPNLGTSSKAKCPLHQEEDQERVGGVMAHRANFDEELEAVRQIQVGRQQNQDWNKDRVMFENVLLRDGVEKWQFEHNDNQLATPTRHDRLFGRSTVNARLPNPQQQQQDQSVQNNFGDVQVPPRYADHIQEFGSAQYAVAVHNVGSKDKEELGIKQHRAIRQNTRDTRTVKTRTTPLVAQRNAMIEEQGQLEQQILNERDRLNQQSQAIDVQREALQRHTRQIQEQMILSDRKLAQSRERHVIELDRLNSEIDKMEIHHPQRTIAAASIKIDKLDENLKKKTDPEPAQSTVVLMEEIDSNDNVSDISNERSNKNSSVDRIVCHVKKLIPNVERQQVGCALLKLQERMGGRVKNESFSELVKLVVTELKPVCSVLPVQRKSVAELNMQIPQSTIALNRTGENNQHVVTEQETAQPLQTGAGFGNSTIPKRESQVSGSVSTSIGTGADNSTLTMRIGRELNINIHLPRQEVQQEAESQSKVLSESDQTEKGLDLEKDKIDAAIDLIDFGSD